MAVRGMTLRMTLWKPTMVSVSAGPSARATTSAPASMSQQRAWDGGELSCLYQSACTGISIRPPGAGSHPSLSCRSGHASIVCAQSLYYMVTPTQVTLSLPPSMQARPSTARSCHAMPCHAYLAWQGPSWRTALLPQPHWGWLRHPSSQTCKQHAKHFPIISQAGSRAPGANPHILHAQR